jgi:ABC-2 type transport system ATP-binding protein
MEASHPMIELQNLVRAFGATRAVDDVSFSVERGAVFGYIGPNGAGKTTSMRILATIDVPDAGDAFIDGFSVIDDPDRVRRRLGFMPDSFGVYANMDVGEYLDFFSRAYGLRGPARLAAVERIMRFTGLDLLAQKPVNKLSKGMKQRLGLGRALVHDPAVLVLDEPAAALDPHARIELRQMLRTLAGEGKTILISSHILTELAEIVDRVAILEQGRLVAVGTVEEILRRTQPTARRMVEVYTLDDPGRLAQWLTTQEGLSEIAPDGEMLTFVHGGDTAVEAVLLRRMIEAGFRISAFGSRRGTLEDAFLQVTKGAVQ